MGTLLVKIFQALPMQWVWLNFTMLWEIDGKTRIFLMVRFANIFLRQPV